jgi:hypothetical protein
MLYLGIDQHRKQLTVEDRNEAGDVTTRRQVSTKWDQVRAFFADYAARARPEGGFVAVLEVCGFNQWLVKLLHESGCRQVILIQPEKRSKRKTDRRDASALAELLWVNRQRLLAAKKVRGVRRVDWPGEQDADDRQRTVLRQRLGHLADGQASGSVCDWRSTEEEVGEAGGVGANLGSGSTEGARGEPRKNDDLVYKELQNVQLHRPFLLRGRGPRGRRPV